MGMMNKKSFAGWKPGQKVKPLLVTCDQHGVEGICKCPTKQEFAQEANINHVMRNYPGNLALPAVKPQGVFADVSRVQGMAEILRLGDSARESFMSLPAQMRARFKNDPYTFLEFITNDKNYDEAVSLGLVMSKKEPPAPERVETPAAPGVSKPESTPKA